MEKVIDFNFDVYLIFIEYIADDECSGVGIWMFGAKETKRKKVFDENVNNVEKLRYYLFYYSINKKI